MRRICVLSLAAVFLLSLPALSDERPVLLKDDVRLHPKVTLKLACEPLSEFTKAIAQATGVRIYVRRAIADQNVTIFAEDMPAWEAMKNIALLFGYGWEMRGKEPNHGYVLFRSMKAAKEADALRNEHWAKEDTEFRNRIEDGIKLIQSDLETIQKEFDKNPHQVRAILFHKNSFELLACFSKEERDAIWARIAAVPKAEIRIPFFDLPARVQKHYRDIAEGRVAEGDDRWRDLEQQPLVISRRVSIKGLPLEPRLTYFGLSEIGLSTGVGMKPSRWPLVGFQLNDLREAGIDTSSYEAPDSVNYSAPESKAKRVPLKDEKEEKELQETQPNRLSDVLEAASRIFELNIFADDYLFREMNLDSQRTTLPDDIEEALAELAGEFEYEPTHTGKTVLFRNRTWYLDEVYETPKRLATRWLQINEKQGRLELKDLIEIAASINNFQASKLCSTWVLFRHNCIVGPMRGQLRRMQFHLDRLTFCGMLTPNQMKTALEASLSAASMSPNQLGVFAEHLRDIRPDLPDEAVKDCAFRVRQPQEEKATISTDEGYEQEVLVKRGFVTFTYLFGPDDEKEFSLDLEYKVTPVKPSKQQ